MISTNITHSKRRHRSNSSSYWHFSDATATTFPETAQQSFNTRFLTLSQIHTPGTNTPSGSLSTPRKRPDSPHSHSKSAPSTPPAEHEPSAHVENTHIFTPAQTFPLFDPNSTLKLPPKKSASSPLLHSQVHACRPIYPSHANSFSKHMPVDSGDDRDDDSMIYTSWGSSSKYGSGGPTRSSTSLRTRLFGNHSGSSSSKGPKTITTTPGKSCAGETETEADEPPKHLPTSRIIPSSGPLVPPNTLQQSLTPLLFEFSRLLSIVPAIVGMLYNIFRVHHPPEPVLDGRRRPPEQVDYLVSALWAILTGYQCLRLTTGLLTRWRLYYPPLPTLIRLLALQAICWPATHLTLKILGHEKRPVICWAVIGTTTCVSRSVQIWVTSNLWWEGRNGSGVSIPVTSVSTAGSSTAGPSAGGLGRKTEGTREREEKRRGYWKRWGGGKWGGRRWDWSEVGVQCMLPAGLVYFVMAWAEALRREFGGC